MGIGKRVGNGGNHIVAAVPDEGTDREVGQNAVCDEKHPVVIVVHMGEKDIVEFLYSENLQVLDQKRRILGSSSVDKHCLSVRKNHKGGISQISGINAVGCQPAVSRHEVDPHCFSGFGNLHGILCKRNGIDTVRITEFLVKNKICIVLLLPSHSAVDRSRVIDCRRSGSCA